MSDVSAWNPLDSANTAAPPDGWPEFMQPSMVNNTGRMMMGAVRRMYDGLAAGTLVLPYLRLSGGTVTGNTSFTAPVAVNSTLTVSGLLSANGNATISALTTGNFSATGNATVTGTFTAGSVAATGNMAAGGSISTLGTIEGGYLHSTGTVVAATGLYANNETGFGLNATGGNKYISFRGDASFWFKYEPSTDNASYQIPTGRHWVWRASDGAAYAELGPVGGNGAYFNISDRRMKQDIEPATAGLPEILALNPVRFRRVPMEGLSPPRLELGFVAQDVQDVLPEAVAVVGVELADGTGGLGDTEPTLGLASEAIVAALVGAVKTLEARLTAGGL